MHQGRTVAFLFHNPLTTKNILLKKPSCKYRMALNYSKLNLTEFMTLLLWANKFTIFHFTSTLRHFKN